jgi:hypothetical protein
MTSSPQPMQMRRRGGAKRGDHGSFVGADATQAGPTEPAATPTASGAIGTDSTRSTTEPAAPPRRRVAKPVADATAAAKAAYDARPKVIFRGVDEETYYKLRAIYKHQLRSADGIEGWSEFGRHLLSHYVDQYEQAHGEMTGGETVELPPGRRLSQ